MKETKTCEMLVEDIQDMVRLSDAALKKIKEDKVKFARMGKLNASLYRVIHDKLHTILKVKTYCEERVDALEKIVNITTVDEKVKTQILAQQAIYKEIVKMLNTDLVKEK